MAAIANQNGRHMVQYVLLPVNIHLHWNLFIFEFLTIYFDFILAAILKILKTLFGNLIIIIIIIIIRNGAKTRSPQNFIWGLNNNNNKKKKKKKKKKKRCKNNKSPNFVWGLNNKKRSKHNKSPKLRLGDIIICNKLV